MTKDGGPTGKGSSPVTSVVCPTSDKQQSEGSAFLSKVAQASLKHYTKDELELENFELVDQVLELLNTHELWETDDTYTFTNGERWAKFRPEGDST